MFCVFVMEIHCGLQIVYRLEKNRIPTLGVRYIFHCLENSKGAFGNGTETCL